MTAYLLKRVLLAVPVLFIATALVFSALHLAGGDPLTTLLGPGAPAEMRAATRARLGLDKPIPVQFAVYMGNLLRGDFGRSILSKEPVLEMIWKKLPVTAELGASAFTLAYALALPLGIIAALNRNKPFDWISMIFALIGVSMAGFWLALMLMYLFAAKLRWLPPTGHGDFQHLILPMLALGLPRVGQIARITRSSVIEVLGQDYVRTARAKGLRERTVVLVHALRNALIPVISLAGLDLGYIIGGSVVIESVFSRPGIGFMMLKAIYSRDFPVLQGCMIVLASAIILSNIMADVAYVVVDPRISHRAKR